MSDKTVGVPVQAGETFSVHIPCSTDAGQGRITANVKVSDDLASFCAGFSFSSPLDAWDRKKGNMIAERRRLAARNYVVTLPFTSNTTPTTEQVKVLIKERLASIITLQITDKAAAWNANQHKEILPRWMMLNNGLGTCWEMMITFIGKKMSVVKNQVKVITDREGAGLTPGKPIAT